MKTKDLFGHEFLNEFLEELNSCEVCHELNKQAIFSQCCSKYSSKNYMSFRNGKGIRMPRKLRHNGSNSILLTLIF